MHTYLQKVLEAESSSAGLPTRLVEYARKRIGQRPAHARGSLVLSFLHDNVCGGLEGGLAFPTNVNPITITHSFNRAAQIDL